MFSCFNNKPILQKNTLLDFVDTSGKMASIKSVKNSKYSKYTKNQIKDSKRLKGNFFQSVEVGGRHVDMNVVVTNLPNRLRKKVLKNPYISEVSGISPTVIIGDVVLFEKYLKCGIFIPE